VITAPQTNIIYKVRE